VGGVFTRFWLGGPKGKDHWKDMAVGGRVTLRWALGRQGSMAQDRVQWRAFVNRVMSLRVP
jgi:hypothetical protein